MIFAAIMQPQNFCCSLSAAFGLLLVIVVIGLVLILYHCLFSVVSLVVGWQLVMRGTYVTTLIE